MSKYHAQPTTRQGIRFASKKEARRYEELMLLLRAGEIRDLKLQPQYTLQESYIAPEGDRVQAIRYVADFSYERRTKPDITGQEWWIPVVEDVKGQKTQVYELKKSSCGSEKTSSSRRCKK